MDQRHSADSPRRRIGAESAPRAARPRGRAAQPAPQLADVAAPADGSDAQELAQADTTSGPSEPPDPRDPRTLERLKKRTPGGGYEIPDTELVRAIRQWHARGVAQVTQALSQLLIERCMPTFRHYAAGLRQRRELMEDTISAMIEQALREALDPGEVFMTQNFGYYLKCLCIDNFNRALRQEGLSYRRDAQGRPTGRPQHIPRALMEPLDAPTDEQDDAVSASGSLADPHDAYGERDADDMAQAILALLSDPLDRKIFALRAIYKYQWEEIAALCGKTERTMRLRFERARVYLRERVEGGAAG